MNILGALAFHGYNQTRESMPLSGKRGEVGDVYKHPTGHKVVVSRLNPNSWSHHFAGSKYGPATGSGAESLHQHLSNTQHSEEPMKDYFPNSVQMSELAVKHVTDEQAEALMQPNYRSEQFSEGSYAQVLRKHGYGLSHSDKKPSEAYFGAEKGEKIYDHNHGNHYVVLLANKKGWQHYGHDDYNTEHGSGTSHQNLDEHLAAYHRH